MSTESVTLPIVAGGAGAGESVLQLASCKNIIVAGLQGTVNIEAKIGSADWCAIASFSGSTLDKRVDVIADELRVNATNGSASSVEVVAERGSNRTGDIPVPPTNGPGADLDVSLFGERTTLQVSGKSGSGSINVEASGDGINYSTVASFSADGCKTVDCSAAKFLRAAGNNGTATAIGVGAADPAIDAITSPRTVLVYRPNSPNPPCANEYIDWETLVEAAKGIKGAKTIEFIADSAPILIPGGDWEFIDTTWMFPHRSMLEQPQPGAREIIFLEGCKIRQNGMRFESRGAPTIMLSDSSTPVFEDFVADGAFTSWYRLGSFHTFIPLTPSPIVRVPAGVNLAYVCDYSFNGDAFATDPVYEVEAGGIIGVFDFGNLVLRPNTFSGAGDLEFRPQSIAYHHGSGSIYSGPNPRVSYDHPAHTGNLFIPGRPVEVLPGVFAENPQDFSLVQPLHDPDNDLGDPWLYGQCAVADNSAGPVALTLPPADKYYGLVCSVKCKADASVNNVTVNASAGETVEDGASFVLSAAKKQYAEFISDGVSNWFLKDY